MNFLYLLILNIALILVIFIYLNRKININMSSSSYLDNINNEIEDIVTELNNTTERNIIIIESKIKELEEIINKAEKTIKIFGTEIDKRDISFEKYKNMKKNIQLDMNFKNIAKQENNTGIKDKVIEYSRNGISAEMISKKLNIPIGEVDLIISLNMNS